MGLKINGFPDLLEAYILEHQLKGEFSEILKKSSLLSKNYIWNKPQLAGFMDMATAYFLQDKPKIFSFFILNTLVCQN